MADTMRAALESAFEKHSKEEPTEGGTPASGSGGEELGAQTGGSTADPPVTVGTPPAETKAGEQPPAAEGKPAEGKPPAEGKSDEGKPAEGKPGKEAAPDKSGKPPVSWKPAVREHWAKLPLEVRAEVARREAEIQRGLATAAEARNFREEFNEVVRPFEGIIRSQNSTPIAAVRNLMTTAAALTMGSPIQKANVIAEILQNYGVDIQVLDQVLSGKAPKNDPGSNAADIEARVRNLVAQELAPVRNMVSARHQEQTRIADEQVVDFATKNEFADDLADDMADLLESAAKRGRKMTMQQAYDAAARSHPEIGPLYEKVLAARAAQTTNGRAEAARRAASSVRPGGPSSGGEPAKPTDLRGAISAAFDQHARRV